MSYREQENTQVLLVGINGVVVGLDTQNGEILWKNNLPGGGHGDVVISLFGGVALVTSAGDKIFCLDCATGKTIWESKTSHTGATSDGNAILITNEYVFVSKMGYIDCFTLGEGTKLWTQPLTGLGVGRAVLKMFR